jgi:hypothetical protein
MRFVRFPRCTFASCCTEARPTTTSLLFSVSRHCKKITQWGEALRIAMPRRCVRELPRTKWLCEIPLLLLASTKKLAVKRLCARSTQIFSYSQAARAWQAAVELLYALHGHY